MKDPDIHSDDWKKALAADFHTFVEGVCAKLGKPIPMPNYTGTSVHLVLCECVRDAQSEAPIHLPQVPLICLAVDGGFIASFGAN